MAWLGWGDGGGVTLSQEVGVGTCLGKGCGGGCVGAGKWVDGGWWWGCDVTPSPPPRFTCDVHE